MRVRPPRSVLARPHKQRSSTRAVAPSCSSSMYSRVTATAVVVLLVAVVAVERAAADCGSPTCSNNGDCVDSHCECDGDFVGAYCEYDYCDGDVIYAHYHSKTSGEITSNKGPFYAENMDCGWTFLTDDGALVLSFSSFSTEEFNDELVIEVDGTTYGSYSGVLSADSFSLVLCGDQIDVSFTSSAYTVSGGFTAAFAIESDSTCSSSSGPTSIAAANAGDSASSGGSGSGSSSSASSAAAVAVFIGLAVCIGCGSYVYRRFIVNRDLGLTTSLTSPTGMTTDTFDPSAPVTNTNKAKAKSGATSGRGDGNDSAAAPPPPQAPPGAATGLMTLSTVRKINASNQSAAANVTFEAKGYKDAAPEVAGPVYFYVDSGEMSELAEVKLAKEKSRTRRLERQKKLAEERRRKRAERKAAAAAGGGGSDSDSESDTSSSSSSDEGGDSSAAAATRGGRSSGRTGGRSGGSGGGSSGRRRRSRSRDKSAGRGNPYAGTAGYNGSRLLG